MNFSRTPRLLLTSAALFCALGSQASGVALAVGEPKASRAQTLIVGVISRNPKKHFKRLEGMATYLAARLKDHGIKKGAFVVANDNAQM